jgi:prevent-host-death family protein
VKGGRKLQLISIRTLRNNPSALWKILNKGEAVITVNGKPKAIVIDANDDNFEEVIKIIRRMKAETAVEKMRLLSIKNGLDKLPQKDIEKEIKKVRKSASSS